MRLSRFFIARPIFAIVVSIVTVILGLIAYVSLPVAQFPDIVPPTVVVTATYPGANASTIADTVASVLEQEINGVEGMIYMYSQATNDGTLTINISFELGTDVDKAQVLVQNRVATATPRLPDDVRRTGVTVKKSSPDLLLVVHLLSPDKTYDNVYISNYALINVRDELARITGVGDVSLFGQREYSMRVWLDPEKIASLNMTTDDVLNGLRAQNIQVAGGILGQPPVDDTGAFQTALQLKGRLTDPKEFENIVVKTSADGHVVYLRDIGRAELGALNYATYGYQDRNPATVLVVVQQPGSNAIDTANAIKKEMARIALTFPKGLEYRIIYNPTEFIEVSISALYETIFEAVGLVVLVVLLFLQSWRATLIPLLAIPVSLIGTFALMAALGYSINMLTLFGLVLAVGIVVDDAIVVVENVERKLAQGLSPVDAAGVTMDEVGAALIAIALVLTAVFVPTAFVSGITGQFYRQFAVTVASATVISAFNSLTLSPAMCALLLRPHRGNDAGANRGALASRVGAMLATPVNGFFHGFNRGFDALAAGYGRLARAAIAHMRLMVALYIGLIGLAAWMVSVTPAGFIPKMDRGIVIVSLQLPSGASLARTDAVVQRVTDIMLQTPGIIHTSGYSGRSGATFTNASNAGAIFGVLDDAEKRAREGLFIDTVAADLRKRLSGIDEAEAFVFIPPPVRGLGGQTGFSMRLQDRANLGSAEFERVARTLIDAANKSGRVANVFTTFTTATPQIFVDVDRDKAQMLKVPLNGIFDALSVYIGSSYVNDITMFGRTWRVTAQADSPFRVDPANVARIRVRTLEGRMVPLGSLVTFNEIAGPDRVPRYNLFPTIEVNGASRPGVSSGQALDTMAALAREVLPQGVTYEWTDLSFQEKRAGRTGYAVFGLSVVFVFLALAAQFESWSLPLAILLIVPMCLLSALFGVRLHGQEINILTQIGFIVLIGLAAKNAILIVEFATQLEAQGRDRVTAAVEAAKLRLRPILMTSLAFTLGVVPLYQAIGPGYELRVALGTAVFWGMIGVTLFGLMFTPVFYVGVRALFGAGKRPGAVAHGAPAAAE